jgi:hypothetical protein
LSVWLGTCLSLGLCHAQHAVLVSCTTCRVVLVSARRVLRVSTRWLLLRRRALIVLLVSTRVLQARRVAGHALAGHTLLSLGRRHVTRVALASTLRLVLLDVWCVHLVRLMTT